MTERVRKQRTTADAKQTESAEVAKTEHKTGDELKAELDALLDEIDDVLEANAEEFVAQYVQKGGQ